MPANPTTTAPEPAPLQLQTDKAGVFTLEIPREVLKQLSTKFPEGVNVLVCPPSALTPEFIRLPKQGEVCSVTGLSRSSFNELLRTAGRKKVPVYYLRQPGAATGIPIIPRQKLIDYIYSLPCADWQPEDSEEEA